MNNPGLDGLLLSLKYQDLRSQFQDPNFKIQGLASRQIYRLGKDKETLINPSSLSGEDILPGLTIDLTDIF